MNLLCAQHLSVGGSEVAAATVWNGRAVCRACLTVLSDQSTTEGWDAEELRGNDDRRAVDDLRRFPRTNR